jgi:hypothetical protein
MSLTGGLTATVCAAHQAASSWLSASRALVVELTQVDPVAQDMPERAIGQRNAAKDSPGAEGTLSGDG